MRGYIIGMVMCLMMGFPCTLQASDVQQFLDILELSQRAQERKDKAIIRPMPQEREAIQELLDIAPPPKTLIPADRQFLQDLLNKVAWTGLERRLMHAMYKEVQGRDINLPEPTQEQKEK